MGPAWSVRGHPETVQLSGTDQSPGAPEAAQSALPHTGPTQRPRDQVTQSEHVTYCARLIITTNNTLVLLSIFQSMLYCS